METHKPDVPMVFWDSNPPTGVTFVTHRLTFFDALTGLSWVSSQAYGEPCSVFVVNRWCAELLIGSPQFIRSGFIELFDQAIGKSSSIRIGRYANANVYYRDDVAKDEFYGLTSSPKCRNSEGKILNLTEIRYFPHIVNERTSR